MSKKESKQNQGNEKRKRKFGDRRDAYRVRDIDSMHVLMPYLMPNRTDNEAFLAEVLWLENLKKQHFL